MGNNVSTASGLLKQLAAVIVAISGLGGLILVLCTTKILQCGPNEATPVPPTDTPTSAPTSTPTDTPTPTEIEPNEAHIPTPDLALRGTELYEAGGKQWVRYRFSIANWDAFPDELFEPAPDLPPCGLNTNASRTWVDIYDASNNVRLYGFCGLSSPQDLNSIWFAVEQGVSPPATVYISLIDRREETNYRSNAVSIP